MVKQNADRRANGGGTELHPPRLAASPPHRNAGRGVMHASGRSFESCQPDHSFLG
jgi:hypothetical protein